MNNPRDALAAKHFPEDWARVVNAYGKSKQRQKLRKAAEDCEAVGHLHESGARCANCRSFNTQKIFGLDMAAHCDMQSDFHGYVEARPDGLCKDWGAKEP